MTAAPLPAAGYTINIGSLNVATLAGRLPEVLALARRHSLHVLAIQETRVHLDSHDAVARTAQHAGYSAHFLPPPSASPGGGLLCLTSLPAASWALPANPAFDHRAQALRLHRPQARPVTLINFHGPPSDPSTAAEAATALLAQAQELGDPWIFIGDHNRLSHQWPYATLAANGEAYFWDDFFLVAPHHGTRRRPDGTYTGRTVDFALAHRQLRPTARHQHRGPGDHDLVVYSVEWNPPPPTWTFPRPPSFGAPSPQDATRWDACWTASGPAFSDALARNDLDTAWTLLSNAAETALGAPTTTRCRAPLPRVRDPTGHTHAPRCQPLVERKLRRLARRAAELARSPQPPPAAARPHPHRRRGPPGPREFLGPAALGNPGRR